MSDFPDANDLLMGSGGVQSASFKNVGDHCTGFIMSQPEPRQRTDINTGKPLTWPDGRNQMMIVVRLMTEEKDPNNPEDSGERQLFINLPSNMSRAVADAVREAGAKGLAIGGKLQVIYTGEGEKTEAWKNPPKTYTAKYRQPEVSVETSPQDSQVQTQTPQQQEQAKKIADEVPF